MKKNPPPTPKIRKRVRSYVREAPAISRGFLQSEVMSWLSEQDHLLGFVERTGLGLTDLRFGDNTESVAVLTVPGDRITFSCLHVVMQSSSQSAKSSLSIVRYCHN